MMMVVVGGGRGREFDFKDSLPTAIKLRLGKEKQKKLN